MNRVSFIACLWLLGGTLLTYGLPTGCCSPVTLEPLVPNPSIAIAPSNGEVVGEGTKMSSAGNQADTAEKQDTTGTVTPGALQNRNSSQPTTTVKPPTSTPAAPTTSTPSPTPPTTTSIATTQTTTSTAATTSATTAQPKTTEHTTTTQNTTPSTTHVVPTSVIPNSTQDPEPKKPTSAPETDRRFDGPSFIGGIVFALGVTAIGFVAWKFYKARTERNYHTL